MLCIDPLTLFFFSLYYHKRKIGIDPQKSKIFVQSHVPAHAELTWLLNCMTPMNWLERMIQFKEKSRKSGGTESVGAGLFTYPILMTADILLYQAANVPVGEDQRQHLELARDIARRFHDLYCKGNAFKKRCKQAGIPSRPTFTEPNAMIVESGISRIMSLTDGTSKMSKSDPNDQSRINILDPPDVIRQKIKRCKTDSLPGIEWDNPERPEATNLLNIYRAVTGESREEIMERFGSSTWGKFKPELADAIIAHLEPIQNRYHEIRQDPPYLEGVLREGADAANAVANQTLHAAKVAMGFVPPPPPSISSA
jgi:tryptophanyl-tRNA synthetase